MSNIESRFLKDKVEVRVDKSTGEEYIEGRGIVFNENSHDLGGFQERIDPSAMDGVDLTDVLSFFNHDPNIVMGRTSSGTMELDVRSDGVYYKVKPPKGHSAYVENIKRGDVTGSSFMFRVKEDGESWEERSDGTVIRTINGFASIKEIGAVVSPAYPQATSDVAMRSLEAWKEDNKPEKPEEKKEVDNATKLKGYSLRLRAMEELK